MRRLFAVGSFVQVNEDSRQSRGKPLGYDIAESGCWEWVGAKFRAGYGQWNRASGTSYAHRLVYERERGPIPVGLQLDHLCRNKGCVNPDHLEPVTQRENVLRGVGMAALQARKTHCLRGHPLAEGNLIPGRVKRGWRGCLACQRRRSRERRLVDKARREMVAIG